jgi:hypothetical protein|tara:strand:- start:501 stop:1238 length:738 start_codon:yes stop_codon:yes gene_type:complete
MTITKQQLKAKIETLETQKRKNNKIQEEAQKALFAHYVYENMELKNVEAFFGACHGPESEVKPNYNLYFNYSYNTGLTTVEVSCYSWRIEQGQGDFNAYLDTIVDSAEIARFIENNLDEIQIMLSTCKADVEEVDKHYLKYCTDQLYEMNEADSQNEAFQKMEYLKEGVEFDEGERVELKRDYNPRVKAIKVTKETDKTFTVEWECAYGLGTNGPRTESRVNKSNVINDVFGWDYKEVEAEVAAA